jgi:hypothetical protein
VDVEAIIQRADEDIADAEAQVRAEIGRLQEAQQRVTDAEKRLEELRQLKQGFLQTIERYGKLPTSADTPEHQPVESPGSEQVPHPWLGLTQADAVLAAMAEIGRPATTGEIHDKLKKSGRPEDAEQIRSTVGYLYRRTHRIMRVSRGLWELPASANGAAGHAAAGDGWANEEVPVRKVEQPSPNVEEQARRDLEA